MTKPKHKPPLDDDQLRALGHVTLRGAALEHIMDHLLFSLYVSGYPSQDVQERAAESPPREFRRRMRLICDNLHKVYDADLASEIVGATIEAVTLHKRRSNFVHSMYGKPEEESEEEIKVITTKHFPLTGFEIRTEEHTVESMESLAREMSELVWRMSKAMGQQANRNVDCTFGRTPI